MSVLVEPRFWLVVATVGVVTALAARVAGLVGWGDEARTAAERRRKPQARAVPAVGGIALLAGWLLAPSDWMAGVWAALVLVFLVGLVDDRRALGPLAKFLLQGLALFPVLLAITAERGGFEGVLLFLAAWAAVNVANTFDNADGALAGTAAVGFAFASPWALAGVLGFLPFNLDAPPRRGDGPRTRGPSAYLGDAGAFVLGLTLALEPVALAALWLPALDLFRLAVVRVARGSRPWIGDRRHLAHGLEARGLSPRAVALLLALAALPGVAGAALEARRPGSLGLGLAVGAGLYLVLWRWAPAPEPGEVRSAA